jgi:hypothetical protein
VVRLVDPTQDPVQSDTLGIDAYFLSVSPNRRWLAWRNEEPMLYLETWPERDRRWAIESGVYETYWTSENDLLLHQPGGNMFIVRIDPSSDPPFSAPEFLFFDPRKGETPGWSSAVTADDRIIHVRSPDQPQVQYVRMIPGWLSQMKKAVDEANRDP